MIVLLTRHGRTNYNDLRLCNADPDVDVYLTPMGVDQAIALGAELKKYDIQRIYISDLPRTHETVKYCIPNPKVPIVRDNRLSDIKTGCESRPVSEFMEYIGSDLFNRKAPGGESFQELKGRVHDFIEDLATTCDETILIVTHMDPAKIITGYFEKLSDLETWNLEMPNCSLLEFRLV